MFRKLMERDSLTMTNKETGEQYGIRQWASGIVLDSSTLGRVEGIRKFAKACSKSIGQWNSTGTTKNIPSEVPPRYSEISLGRPSSSRNSQRSRGTYNNSKDQDSILSNYPNITNLHNGKSRDAPHSRGYLTEKSIRHYSSESNIAEITNDKLTDSNLRRIVLVKNIPKGVGVTSVLDKVCGGPLEMVDWTLKEDDLEIELYFISPQHAHQFYTYGNSSGLLIVHGIKLKVQWVSPNNSLHPGLAMSPSFSATIDINSRRCLVLARTITDKQCSTHYLDPRSHFSHEINIKEIKQDFSQFGVILEVTPVVSRFVSLCIQFTNVRSAVMAKRCCEKKGTGLNHKYKNWSFFYGKDPADIPCIHP